MTLCAADGLVGVSFGALAINARLPAWLPILLSLVVFTGAAQFVFLALLAAGGNPLTAVLPALLVNTRLVPLGYAVGDLLGSGRARRLLGCHLVVDETVAFATSKQFQDRGRAMFWSTGLALFVTWNCGVAIGTVAARALTDTTALGLDAAFPAVLLALVMPSLDSAASRLAGLLGAVVAALSTPLLPAGLPVLIALVAVPPALRRQHDSAHVSARADS
jgi:4-azaleucine resistance transporter AzlC